LSAQLPSAVLFVCTFNRVRSPMAAGLMRKLYGETVRVDSCGLAPGEEVDPLAAAVMAEIGVDLSDHEPKRLDDLLETGWPGAVVALSADAWQEGQGAGGKDAINWPTPDPTESEGSRETRLEAYRLTLRDLESRILACFGPSRHAFVRA
jgi:protein-tyrosine-phosphatase